MKFPSFAPSGPGATAHNDAYVASRAAIGKNSVRISTTTSGATIRYTTNNTAPTCTTGTVHVNPIKLTAYSVTTLKAIACATGKTPSPVITGTYTFGHRTPPVRGTVFLNEESPKGYCGLQGTISTAHPGYNDTGYADITNATGKGIDYSVSATSAGFYGLTFRYENGSPNASITRRILVNGVVAIDSAKFPKTSSTSTWTVATFGVDLPPGVSRIRLETTSSVNFANIDHMQVSGGATAANCN